MIFNVFSTFLHFPEKSSAHLVIVSELPVCRRVMFISIWCEENFIIVPGLFLFEIWLNNVQHSPTFMYQIVYIHTPLVGTISWVSQSSSSSSIFSTVWSSSGISMVGATLVITAPLGTYVTCLVLVSTLFLVITNSSMSSLAVFELSP